MKLNIWGAGVLIFLLSNCALAVIIDFETFSHGDELTSVTVDSVVVDFVGTNIGGGPDKIAIFDTGLTGTRDPDLQGPPNTNWAGGNLSSPQTAVGKAMIVQENTIGYNPPGDTVFDEPDDEAGGGHINIKFSVYLVDFQIDFLDSELSENFGHHEIHFYKDGAELTPVSPIRFDEFDNILSPFYDPTIAYGDHHANRLPKITSDDVGDVFDEVRLHMRGSGAFDNLVFTSVPEPATVLLLGLGVSGLLRKRRM